MPSTSDFHNLSDHDLVVLFRQQQDPAITGELFRRYAHLVMGTCLKYLKNEEASKDAVMAIFEKLLNRMHKFEIQNFSAWLYQVTKNYCFMELRKAQSQSKKHGAWQEDFLMLHMDTQEEMHLTNEPSFKEENLAKMHEALQKLKPEQKRCVELFYLEGQSYQQIAETTGFSIKKVKSYLQNGKRNLQKMTVNSVWLASLLCMHGIEALDVLS